MSEETFNNIKSKVYEWNAPTYSQSSTLSTGPPDSPNTHEGESYFKRGFVILKHNWMYLTIPIAVVGTLVLIKPWFLLKKRPAGVNPKTHKDTFDILKLLICIVVISAALWIGLFAYKYKYKYK